MAEAPKEQTQYKRPGFIRRFFTRFFVFIGVITTLIIVGSITAAVKMADYAPAPLPDKILLTYTFKEGLAEYDGGAPSLSQPLLKTPATFRDIIDALHKAEKDNRVKGFAAHLQDATFNVAQAQELRDTIAEFRKSGKFAYIFADSYGGFTPGMSDYYLACSFDQIWLAPVGMVGINGVAAEVPFVRGILDKIGVIPQFSHKGKYKSASESLTETDITAPNREATEDLVNDLFDQLVKGISADRKIPEADLLKLVDNAPYTDDESLKNKLVDHLGGYDEFIDQAKKDAGITTEKPADLISSYAAQVDKSDDKKDLPDILKKYDNKPEEPAKPAARKIALIYGVGEMVSYKDEHGTFGGDGMSAEKVTEAFKAAEKDGDVAAIVFRVDSPGGSAQAAETIRRVMVDARKKGRPIIMSMGGMAASGGYWIATGADKVVAQPATLTGSIGVFGGKMVVSPLWDKLSVNWVGIQKGGNARMWSSNKPFSDAEYARFDALLNNTYEEFLSHVSDARKMTHDQADAIAQGRVWTGREAKDRGLVDELGGLDKAIELAKKEAKLDTTKEIKVQVYPPPQNGFDQLMTMLNDGENVFAAPHITGESIIHELENEAHTQPQGILRAPLMEIH
jgi:protease IV